MTELSDLYSDRIIELAAHIPHGDRLENADATATAHSKLCGSTISIDIKLKDDRVSAYGQTVKACLLGQSAASIMGHNIIGTTPAELRDIAEQMRKMLKENGQPPGGRWKDLEILEPIRDFAPRHASTLLVFNAVVDALDQIGNRDRDNTAALTSKAS